MVPAAGPADRVQRVARTATYQRAAACRRIARHDGTAAATATARCCRPLADAGRIAGGLVSSLALAGPGAQ